MKESITFTTCSDADTREIGRIIGTLLFPKSVVALSGDLGAGKTVMASGIAFGAGVSGVVNSPTYTIIKEYMGDLPFYHMDLYRLSGESDLAEMGYDEYIESDGVTVIEWYERAEGFFPNEYLRITIEHADEPNVRTLNIKAYGDTYKCVVERLGELCA